MIRRSTFIAAELVIGVLAAVALLSGVAVWRLSSGPVQLGFLTPYLEDAYASSQDGGSMQVGETVLTWAGWERSVDLHIRDVVLLNAEGLRFATLPEVALRLSLRALLQGKVAPTLVEIAGARVHMVRLKSGSFQIGPVGLEEMESAATDKPRGFSTALPGLVAELMADPDPQRPLSFLQAVRIVSGRVTIDDRKMSRFWQVPLADIELRRDALGLAGELDLDFAGSEESTRLSAGFVYDKTEGLIDVAASFSGLYLADLARAVPDLEPVGGIASALEGTVSATLDLDGRIGEARFAARAGAGELTVPDLIVDAVPFQALQLEGSYDGREPRIDVRKAEIAFGTADGGPTLSLVGTVTSDTPGFAANVAIEADVEAAAVPIAELGHYWPESLAVNARGWIVENLTDGIAERAAARVKLSFAGSDFSRPLLSDLGGSLDYRDLEVHFLRPLPPILGVSGTASFDMDTFTFAAGSGHLDGLQVEDSTVIISGLEASRVDPSATEDMQIDATVSGPVADALLLLDHERLDLLSSLGITPAGSLGQAKSRLSFAFPLLADLGFDDIAITAQADMTDVGIKGLLFGADMSGGQLALSLTKEGMRVVGPLQLGDVPMQADWSENFTDEGEYTTFLKALIPDINEAQRKNFGVDLGDVMTGPVSAEVIYTARGQFGQLKAAVNLAEATLDVPAISWSKEPGQPGEAHFEANLVDDRIVSYKNILVRAGALQLLGEAWPGEQGNDIERFEFVELEFGGSTLTGVTLLRRGGSFDVNIGGGILDAKYFLAEDSVADSKEGEGAASGVRAEGQPAADEKSLDRNAVQKDFTPFTLSAEKIDAVFFAEDRYFENVSLKLERTHEGWRQIYFTGYVPEELLVYANAETPAAETDAVNAEKLLDHLLRIEFGPDGEGSQTLLVVSDDLGSALRAMDVKDEIIGGGLEISGRSDGPLPRHILTARIEARDFKIVEAPLMARILNIASLTGVQEVMRGKGLVFQRLVGSFKLEDGLASSDLIRAYGGSLGLTAKGSVDFDSNLADLQGTLVPAYAVNRLLGGIPLLGPILVGGEGEGILAVTYSLRGDLADPKIKVNPLSALAPGFLRGLFSGEGKVSAIPEDYGPDR